MRVYFAGPLFDRHPRSPGGTGDYNAMLTHAATARIDLPAASTTEVIAAILDALSRTEPDGR